VTNWIHIIGNNSLLLTIKFAYGNFFPNKINCVKTIKRRLMLSLRGLSFDKLVDQIDQVQNHSEKSELYIQLLLSFS
jgi:hypothetical protein